MQIVQQLRHIGPDEEAVTAIEYGLIAALIAVAIIISVALVGSKLDAVFAAVAAAL
ncbi:MAG: Flp family type IVb pilin [Comamonadaceae bacterium]|jgi:pilus assembly protein Flp/PilA|nr:Flp family type IVb pilin [Comamonadaceae bacterium]